MCMSEAVVDIRQVPTIKGFEAISHRLRPRQLNPVSDSTHVIVL